MAAGASIVGQPYHQVAGFGRRSLPSREWRLSGDQSCRLSVGCGSGTAGREGLERSFKRPGGQEDVQTLPTAVHRPCLSPLNASDDCNAPIADIVPPH